MIQIQHNDPVDKINLVGAILAFAIFYVSRLQMPEVYKIVLLIVMGCAGLIFQYKRISGQAEIRAAPAMRFFDNMMFYLGIFFLTGLLAYLTYLVF